MKMLLLLLHLGYAVTVLMSQPQTMLAYGVQPDEVQLSFIQETRRVLFTQDADFLLIASLKNDHPGITYCKKGNCFIGEIIRMLALLYEVMTLEEMVGRVEFL